MKCSRIFCVLISLLVALLVFCACRENSNTATTDTYASEAHTSSESLTDSATQKTTEQKETQDVYFVTEADQLEIITAPAQEDKSQDENEPNQSANTSKQTEPQTESKTEVPRIELPFVPAN